MNINILYNILSLLTPTKEKAWHESAGLCFSGSSESLLSEAQEKQSPKMSEANSGFFF